MVSLLAPLIGAIPLIPFIYLLIKAIGGVLLTALGTALGMAIYDRWKD